MSRRRRLLGGVGLGGVTQDVGFWVDASDSSTITESSDLVSQWNDKSSNGYNVTATGTGRPLTNTNTLNGNNVITFGGDDFLTIPSGLATTLANGDYTMFIVSRQTGGVAQERLITLATAGASTRLTARYSSSSAAVVFSNNSTGTAVNTSAGLIEKDYNIITCSHSDAMQSISSNASTEVINNSASDQSDATQGTIGANGNGGGDFLNGDIAEIIIYTRLLTAQEKLSVQCYLYYKWGVLIKGTLDLSDIIPSDVTAPFNVSYDGYTFSTDIDMSTYQITPTNTYNIATTGSDGSGDGSSGNPWASFDKAIQEGNTAAATFQVTAGDGIYNRFETWEDSNTPDYDINVISSTGASNTTSDSATYALDSSDTYVATVSAGVAANLYDIRDTTVTDADGNFEQLTDAGSIANCRSTSGTYYLDTLDLYIHASDDRNLTGDNVTNGILVLISALPPEIDEPINAFLQNINMYGGSSAGFLAGKQAEVTTTGLNVYYDGGSIGYNEGGNAVSVVNAQTAIFKDVTTSNSYLDGFNNHYYLSGSRGTHYEIDCEAYNNGSSAGGSNNSSTVHDGVFAMRVNGIYDGAESRNIHDIDDGTFSINLGSISRDSRGGGDTTSINYMCGDGDGGDSRMYLIGCQSSGSNKDLRAEDGASIYVNPSSALLDGDNVINGTGRITPYLPTVLKQTTDLPILGGLQLWLDASDSSTITESSGAVSQWDDKSGNGNNAVQGNTEFQPVYSATSFNGKPGITPGQGQYLDATLNWNEPCTIISVQEYNNTSGGRVVWGENTIRRELQSSTTDGWFLYDGSVRTISTTPADDTIMAIRLNNDSTFDANVNGTYYNGLTKAAPAAADVFRFGNYSGANSGYQKAITEVLVYDRLLTDSEINIIYNYLSQKWNVAFNPSNISSLSLWLDASDSSTITESSGAVSQWDDKSGNGNNAVQAGGESQPTTNTRTIGTKNAIDFNGSTHQMVIPADTTLDLSTGDFTIFMVYQTDTVSGFRWLLNKSTSNSDLDYLMSATNGRFLTGDGPVDDDSTTITEAVNTPYIWQISNDLSGTTRTFTVNGAAAGSFTISTGDVTSSDVIIGSRGGTQYYDGLMAEILIYKKNLSTAEVSTVQNYLSNKWNITT